MIQQNFIHQIGDSTCITLVIVVFLLYGGEYADDRVQE